MRNKPFIFLILFLVLSSCGYQPIYSTKNLNFTIGKVEKENTSLNNKFAKSINTLTNRESDKKINIKIESDKNIRVKSKDSKGNTLVLELEINLKFINLASDNQVQQSLSRKITYNNSDDKFKLKEYEKELEEILITKIIEDLINYLSNI